MTKYRAKPVIVTEDGTMFEVAEIKKYNLQVEGIRFDSKAEAKYYLELKHAKALKVIKDFSLQPKFILQESPRITYIADFEVIQRDGSRQIVDVKGMETATFRIKKNLFEALYPELELQVITFHGGQWKTLDQVKQEKRERKKAERELIKRARKVK